MCLNFPVILLYNLKEKFFVKQLSINFLTETGINRSQILFIGELSLEHLESHSSLERHCHGHVRSIILTHPLFGFAEGNAHVKVYKFVDLLLIILTKFHLGVGG